MKKGKIPEWLKLDREARRKIELANSSRYSPSVQHKTHKLDVEDRTSNEIKPQDIDDM